MNYEVNRITLPKPKSVLMAMAAEEKLAQEAKEEKLMLAAAKKDEEGEMTSSEDYTVKQFRLQAMAVVLEWLRNGDGSFGEFEEFAIGLADLDGDGEIEDGEETFFNDVLGLMSDALVKLGASIADVQEFIGSESDDKGEEISFSLSDKMPSSDEDDNVMTDFMTGGEMMLAATVKVIRNGQVKLIKKKLKKRRISSAQRAGLKKARRSAHKSGAKLNRKKSMRLRKSRNI